MTGISETEAADRLGVSRQTLRNWRVGNGRYPARLEKGVHWRKVGATVVFDAEWVERMEIIMRQKDELLNN